MLIPAPDFRQRFASPRARSASVLLALLVGAACSDSGDGIDSLALRSPDGRLEVQIATLDLGGRADFPDGPGLYYAVSRDGVPILGWAPLGLEGDRGSFVVGLEVVGTSRRGVSAHYTTVVGKRRERTVEGRELTLRTRNPEGEELDVVFRAHDDGIAFRYHFPGEGMVSIAREATGFAPSIRGHGYMAPYDVFGLGLAGTYEQLPQRVVVGERLAGSGWAYPALFEPVEPGGAWVLVTEADLDGSYCGTRLHQHPVENVYRVRFPRPTEGTGVGGVQPYSPLPLTTPWRVILVGDLSTVVASTLVDDLSRPSVVEDASWVRPGRAAWSWYSQAVCCPELQREYVDFAEEMGWEYVLVDANWSRWDDAEREIPALVANAAARGVGIFLWYNSGGPNNFVPSEPRDRLFDPAVRRGEFDKLAAWGVAGIKVDFFYSDKQDRIQQYLGILQDAADRRLLVNFHGATLPRGWQRTYPHLVTVEAVQGAEAFLLPFVGPRARHDVLYAFGRNVVGSMDYTPVVFSDALERVGSTYAHSLALAVVFESGVQHFADRADHDPTQGYRAVFADFPFAGDFLAEVPVAWDDIVLLDGDPASHVALARRHGDRWYVGAINGPRALPLDLPLGFLGSGTYDVSVIHGDRDPSRLVRRTSRRTSADVLSVELHPNDGFVATLVPRSS